MPSVPVSWPHRPLSPPQPAARATQAAAGSEQLGALLIPVTCVADGLDHRVSDASLDGVHRPGRYWAQCGRLVIPAPLVAPPGPPCRACAAVSDHGHQHRKRNASRGVLALLVRVFFQRPQASPEGSTRAVRVARSPHRSAAHPVSR